MAAVVRRILRNPLNAITFGLWVVVVAITIVLVAMLVDLLRSPPSPDALSGIPPWVKDWLIPFFQRRLRWLVPVVVLAGALLVLALSALTLKFHRADKFSLFGLSFEVPDELQRAHRELTVAAEQITGLQENANELADLVEVHSGLLLTPSKEAFFDALDLMAQTAAFTIRPEERSVRASIWLCEKGSEDIRMVAAYRIGSQSRRHLVLKMRGDGFAAHVLRSNAPQAKENPTSGRDWVVDTRSNSSTSAILGQPIQVGPTDAWRAVLCFSTDRDLARFRPFSPQEDAAGLRLFSALISATLTSALTWNTPITQTGGGTVSKPLIEVAFRRYA